MTNEEAKKMLKAKLECLIRETSGTDRDCNYKDCDECNLCYEQGNMGEQKEALELAIKALDQELVLDKIRAEIEQLPTTKCTETHRIYIDADDFKKNVLVILDKYESEE